MSRSSDHPNHPSSCSSLPPGSMPRIPSRSWLVTASTLALRRSSSHTPPGTFVIVRSLPERVTARGFEASPVVGAGKPDLIARRRPENSLQRGPAGRKFSFWFLAIGADHGERTFVIAPWIFMIGEGDPLAVRRNLRMTHPVDAVEQHFADGILQTPMIIFRNVVDDRQTVAVGGKVGVSYVVQHLAWRSSTQRHPCQRSASRVAAVILGVEPDGQLSGLGDRKQLSILNSQFS